MLRRKNPKLTHIAKEILSKTDNWRYLSEGGNGETYYFELFEPLEVNKILLFPEKYVLKLEWHPTVDEHTIKEKLKTFKELSNLNLIPKIYYMDSNITIMKYIEGKTLNSIYKILNIKERKIVYNNIENLVYYWHFLNKYHGDLKLSNIIINNNLEVFFIDPIFSANKGDDIFDLDKIKYLLLL